MPEDADVADDDEDEERGNEGSDIAPQRMRPSQPFPRLDAFAGLQRQLAAIDFSALTASQRAISHATAFQIPQIVAAQDAIAKQFAQTVDFTRLTDSYRHIIDASKLTQGFALQKQWADSLAASIDFSALNSAFASSAAIAEFTNVNSAIAESLRQQTEIFSRITEGLAFKVPSIDISALIAGLDRWIPTNLRSVGDLAAAATIALEEGLPLSWVPRTEIVVALIEAGDADARGEILDARRDDILDDCDAALTGATHEWAVQCRGAISALRFGLDAPAQSHASNIVDSIVLALHGKSGRDRAKERAQQEFDDLPLHLAAENLTLRPLFRAFTAWWPNTETEPPNYFARHATSHAVGHVGVFAPRSALIAVMLATSLTVEYAPLDSDPVDGAEPADG